MVKYKALAIATKYWRPGDNCLEEIIDGVRGKIANGDFVVTSEKAISTALNNIVNENKVKPSLCAELIAKYWMQMVWGYILGPLCNFEKDFFNIFVNIQLKWEAVISRLPCKRLACYRL